MTHTVETLGIDREAMFPRYHDDIENGRRLIMPAGCIEAAQDRVAMRRLLRPHLPGVDLQGLDEVELSQIIDQMKEVFG